jgi:hypothetical protein
MTLIDAIYLAVAAAVIVLSVRNWRGVMWVAALTASYFVSGLWWRSGAAGGEMVTFLCDAAVFLLIYLVGRKWWEVGLLGIQLLMVITSALYMATGHIVGHEIYSITLELLNAIALLLIGGTSAFIIAGSTDGLAFHNARHIIGFGMAVRGQGDPDK